MTKKFIKTAIGEVAQVNVADEMKKSYIDYAMSVIAGRALPDVRDGLKPVHRRVMFAAEKLGMDWNKQHKKSARVVGDVIGKYHPHGDCLHGDSEFHLLNGEVKTIFELYQNNKAVEGLAYDKKTGFLKPVIAHSFRIGQYANEIYKITLSNGRVIQCTANHPFLSDDNQWIKAEQIKEGFIFKSGKFSENKNKRPSVFFNNKSELIQFISASSRSDYIKGKVPHHIDKNIFNNEVSNFVWLTRSEHAKLHGDYYSGLNKGHNTMFNTDSYIAQYNQFKNSFLMSEHNKVCVLSKAIKVIKSLSDVSERGYELARKSLYNSSKISTLIERGYISSFNDLVSKSNEKYKTKYNREELLNEFFNTLSNDKIAEAKAILTPNPLIKSVYTTNLFENKMFKHRCVSVLKKVISNNGDLSKWDDYEIEKRKIVGRNKNKDVDHGCIYLKNRFKSPLLLAKELSGLISFVIGIEIIKLEEKIPMYDFTVDNDENMILSSGDNSFIVAHNSSVYEALVRMAQPFSMNHILIDGQGNFGSIDGDSPASMRYTECRMSRLAGEFFADVNYETVQFTPNYDGEELEPSVLPVPYPNLLVNGAEGIAVGMACSIPPHNLRDISEATLVLLNNPDAKTEDLVKIIQAPDFPTCGIVYGVESMSQIIETGRGLVRIRAKWHEEPRSRGASRIIIDELPYQANKVSIINKIATMVKDGLITDIVGLNDESDKDGIRLVIDIRAGAIADVVFAQIASKSGLEDSISYNCTVVEDQKPKFYGLKMLILKWIEFRMEVLLNRFIYFRKEANAKLHILNGFMAAFNAMDSVIKIIRESNSPSDAKAGLIDLLSIDEIQVQSILELRLQKLTGMEIDAIKADRETVLAKIADYTSKIENESDRKIVLADELKAIDARYGHPRLTEISSQLVNISHEDMIPREEVLIIVTRNGYVKRLPSSALSEQNRNTRGKRVLEVGDDDEIQAMYQVNSHDLLMVFTESGMALGVKAYSIPESKLAGNGRHIKNVIEGLDEEITAIVAVPEKDPTSCLTIITKKGQVKRSDIAHYNGVTRKGGIRGLNLDEGDTVSSVYVTKPHDHLMMVANTGKTIRIDVEDIRVSGRATSGVRGIMLDDNEFVIGTHLIQGNGNEAIEESINIMDKDLFLLCVGEKGVGKRTKISEFTLQNRGGKGVNAFNTNQKTGVLIKAFGVTEDKDLVLTASNGVSNRIAVDSIRVTGRLTSGVGLINLDNGEKLVSAITAAKQEVTE